MNPIILAVLSTFLYPYSRFVYESIANFIIGKNVFLVSGGFKSKPSLDRSLTTLITSGHKPLENLTRRKLWCRHQQRINRLIKPTQWVLPTGF